MSGIVVGVDGSESSKRALEWAAAEARLRHQPLKLVAAWKLPAAAYGGVGRAGMDLGLVAELRKLAEQRLAETCTELSTCLEGLDVERSVVENLAAAALLDAAADADLLVVGTRGHGGFVGLLLGSVSQQCAHHSPCPIAIIPPARVNDGKDER